MAGRFPERPSQRRSRNMGAFQPRRVPAGLAIGVIGFAGIGLPASPSVSGSSLSAALDTVEVEEIKRDLFVIASDEMGGRDTPSPGLEATAKYLGARLEELGFTHGAPEGWFYEYPLSHLEIDEARTGIVASRGGASIELVLGRDYFIGRTSEAADLDVSGGAVYVGPWGEFEKVHSSAADARAVLAGKWALVVEDGGTARKIAEELQEAGAVGMALIESEASDKPYAERFARTTETLLSARAGRLDTRRPTAAVFPKVLVAREAASKLWAFAGLDAPPAIGTPLGIDWTEHRHLVNPGGRAFLKNVCGYWPGSDPELAEEVIVLSAHYDHVGQRGEEIWNGADDNASGTSGLLAVAEALKAYGPMRRSVLLLWVSAEEKGLLGSEAWTKCPWLPGDARPVADINMDMIGRNAADQLLITPTRELEEHYNGMTRLAEQLAPLEGFTRLESADEYWSRSDHANFAEDLGLPVAFLFCDVHEDYHEPTDDADKIDYDKMRRVVRLVLRMLDGMQTDELRLHEEPVPTAAEFDARERAGTALRELERIRSAVDCYAAWNGGRLPASTDELVSFDGGSRDWFSKNELPLDPWGRAYRITLPSTSEPGRYECFGSDGASGGEGTAADIVLP